MLREKTLFADLALLGVNAIWGITFVTMKNLLAEIPPLTILSWRFLIAFGVLLSFPSSRKWDKKVVPEGAILGVALFGGYLFQTLGLLYVTPARSAFVTGLCTVIVPFFAFFLLRVQIDRFLPISIALALSGLFLLSFNGGNTSGPSVLQGDVLTLFGATAYALQIVLVEKFARNNETFPLVTVEMGTVALLCFTLCLFFPTQKKIPQGAETWGSILFLGVMATALAFTVQKIAQRHTSATHVGVIFVSEPVFAAVFSYFLWQEQLTFRSLAGCGLILLGILTSQFSFSPGAPFPQLSGQTQDLQDTEGR